MDDSTEIYFLDDDDVRNRSRDNDHRGPGRPDRALLAPSPRPRPRVVVARPVQRAQVVQAAPTPTRDGVFANVTTGQLVELATMVIAAIMPLPAAPVAQGVATTDIHNQLAYTSALALHAKRDEQLRTIGALVGKLVG